jgi:hypothetical protein
MPCKKVRKDGGAGERERKLLPVPTSKGSTIIKEDAFMTPIFLLTCL